MSFGGLILTQNGINIQGKVQGGKTLQFTRIGIGSGDLSGPMTSVSSMINEVKSMPIVKFNIATGGKVTLGFVLSNQEIDSGFWWKEIGVYAKDPDTQQELLYAYGNAQSAAEYIPAGAGSTDVIEKNVDVVLVVGTGGTITATIDKSHVYETIEDAEQKIADAVAIVQNNLNAHAGRQDNPHAVTKAQVGLGNADNTSDVNKPVSTAQSAAITAAVNALKAITQNMKLTQDDGQGKSVSETDFNNLINPGVYTISSTTMANSPTSNAGILLVLKGVSNVSQLFFSDQGDSFFRFYQNSSWKSWKKTTISDDLIAHTSRTDNPHSVTKVQVGLGSVDNTSDVNKPVSIAQAAADTTIYNNALNWVKSFGLGANAKSISGTDLNNLNSTGFFSGNSLTNAPNTDSYWFIINIVYDTLTSLQIAESTSNNTLFVRLKAGGSWGPWRTLAGTDSNVASATKLQTPRSISLTGDATGSTSFDGSGNVNIAATLTAASVLSKLLTVDGSGSGLDGDTVDGKHYTDITTAINNAVASLQAITQNSKITSDSSPYYLQTNTGDDAYAKLKSLPEGLHTVYIKGGIVNALPDTKYGKGYALVESAGSVMHILVTTDQGDVFTNYCSSGNFGGWQKINDSASDILTKLKTVDGTGSGVDADLLDGHDSSYFLPTTGNAPTASKLQTARTVSLSGDGTASGSFDGSANLALALVLAASGVTAGTYKSVTVDSKGRVTGGTNPTTLAGYGITDALLASAYTAADVLAKLKTVDGSGSGVDADTLDGSHASSFAPSGYGLGTVGTPVLSDLNSASGSGFYYANASTSNRPTTDETWYSVYCIKNGPTGDITQIATALQANAYTYKRTTYGGAVAWTAWERLAEQSDLDSLSVSGWTQVGLENGASGGLSIKKSLNGKLITLAINITNVTGDIVVAHLPSGTYPAYYRLNFFLAPNDNIQNTDYGLGFRINTDGSVQVWRASSASSSTLIQTSLTYVLD